MPKNQTGQKLSEIWQNDKKESTSWSLSKITVKPWVSHFGLISVIHTTKIGEGGQWDSRLVCFQIKPKCNFYQYKHSWGFSSPGNKGLRFYFCDFHHSHDWPSHWEHWIFLPKISTKNLLRNLVASGPAWHFSNTIEIKNTCFVLLVLPTFQETQYRKWFTTKG